MLRTKQQMSDTFLIGALLAVVGGFLDAYTYVARGGVFANAQTGNMVLFGLHLAEGNWNSALKFFVPIFAFVVGVLVDEWIKKYFVKAKKIHWRQIVLIIEFFVLIAVALLPLGGTKDMIANVLVSFVCSMQVQSFRKVHGLPFATTMCTGNLRSGTEHLYRYSQTKDKTYIFKTFHYYGIIAIFIFGAGIGARATKLYGSTSVFFCCAVLFVICLLLSIHTEEAEPEEKIAEVAVKIVKKDTAKMKEEILKEAEKIEKEEEKKAK